LKNKNKLVNTKPVKQKNKNVQKRTSIMIFLSGVSFCLMHMPDFVISLYLASFFSHNRAIVDIDIYEIGLFEYSSQYFYDLASLLYFVYYSLNYFFFMLFDKNFRKQFSGTFANKKSIFLKRKGLGTQKICV
jgi:hypothetical protein